MSYKISKIWKKKKKKGGFQCSYAAVILFDSIYTKYGNYYPKVYLEKYCFIYEKGIYCSSFDEEYYDEEYINLFWENLEK